MMKTKLTFLCVRAAAVFLAGCGEKVEWAWPKMPRWPARQAEAKPELEPTPPVKEGVSGPVTPGLEPQPEPAPTPPVAMTALKPPEPAPRPPVPTVSPDARAEIEALRAKNASLEAQLAEVQAQEKTLSEQVGALRFQLSRQSKQIDAMKEAQLERDLFKARCEELTLRIQRLERQRNGGAAPASQPATGAAR